MDEEGACSTQPAGIEIVREPRDFLDPPVDSWAAVMGAEVEGVLTSGAEPEGDGFSTVQPAVRSVSRRQTVIWIITPLPLQSPFSNRGTVKSPAHSVVRFILFSLILDQFSANCWMEIAFTSENTVNGVTLAV
jgi:hypothetical protein